MKSKEQKEKDSLIKLRARMKKKHAKYNKTMDEPEKQRSIGLNDY